MKLNDCAPTVTDEHVTELAHGIRKATTAYTASSERIRAIACAYCGQEVGAHHVYLPPSEVCSCGHQRAEHDTSTRAQACTMWTAKQGGYCPCRGFAEHLPDPRIATVSDPDVTP